MGVLVGQPLWPLESKPTHAKHLAGANSEGFGLHKPREIFFSSLVRAGCLTSLLLFSLIPSKAETPKSYLVCRENISSARRSKLEAKLRKISGLPDLGFDSKGALRLGSRFSSGGSKLARALLAKSASGPNTIILEDASRRADVVFAKVVPGRWNSQSYLNAPVYVVLIDFADFDSLMGDGPALSAFDVGWGLLHELDHVVENSEDANTQTDLGECEDHINQMREECNLPLRAEYFHNPFPVSRENDFTTRLVRLSFVEGDGVRIKRKRYWLIWDATVVGGLEDRRVATLR